MKVCYLEKTKKLVPPAVLSHATPLPDNKVPAGWTLFVPSAAESLLKWAWSHVEVMTERTPDYGLWAEPPGWPGMRVPFKKSLFDIKDRYERRLPANADPLKPSWHAWVRWSEVKAALDYCTPAVRDRVLASTVNHRTTRAMVGRLAYRRDAGEWVGLDEKRSVSRELKDVPESWEKSRYYRTDGVRGWLQSTKVRPCSPKGNPLIPLAEYVRLHPDADPSALVSCAGWPFELVPRRYLEWLVDDGEFTYLVRRAGRPPEVVLARMTTTREANEDGTPNKLRANILAYLRETRGEARPADAADKWRDNWEAIKWPEFSARRQYYYLGCGWADECDWQPFAPGGYWDDRDRYVPLGYAWEFPFPPGPWGAHGVPEFLDDPRPRRRAGRMREAALGGDDDPTPDGLQLGLEPGRYGSRTAREWDRLRHLGADREYAPPPDPKTRESAVARAWEVRGRLESLASSAKNWGRQGDWPRSRRGEDEYRWRGEEIAAELDALVWELAHRLAFWWDDAEKGFPADVPQLIEAVRSGLANSVEEDPTSSVECPTSDPTPTPDPVPEPAEEAPTKRERTAPAWLERTYGDEDGGGWGWWARRQLAEERRGRRCADV